MLCVNVCGVSVYVVWGVVYVCVCGRVRCVEFDVGVDLGSPRLRAS